MANLRESDIRRARVRIQRVKGDLMVTGWLDEMSGDSVSLLATARCGLVSGDRILVTIDGESVIIVMAEVGSVVSRENRDLIQATIKLEPVSSAKKSARRVLMNDLRGSLTFMEESDTVDVCDLSTTGAGLLTRKSYKVQALVVLQFTHQGQRIELRARVKYSTPFGGRFRTGVEFLRATPLEKTTLDWIAQAA